MESWRLLVRDGAVWETGVLKERWCLGDGGIQETVVSGRLRWSSRCYSPLASGAQEMVVSRSQCAQETGALGVCPSVRSV